MEVKPRLDVPLRPAAETVDLATPGETTNLRWVTPEKKDTIPLDAFSIYNNYTSRKEYVCRPLGICALGFMTKDRGFYCYYSLQGRQLLANNFQFLQNRKNFELLEWKPGQNGSIPDFSIRNCRHNFVGRNRYGLGNVHSAKKVFYLPWEGEEYWYRDYEVLTINREQYHLLVVEISYDTKKLNSTSYPKEELMESACLANNNSKELVKEVFMQTKHEKLNMWEPSLSMEHMLSINFSAKIPEIVLGRGNQSKPGANRFEWSGYKYRQNVSLRLEHSAVIKPGQCCRVKMMGNTTKISMPFWAQVVKTYASGTKHKASIIGRYMSEEMGGIKGMPGRCETIKTSNITAEESKPTKAEKPPEKGAARPLFPSLGSCVILTFSLAVFGAGLY